MVNMGRISQIAKLPQDILNQNKSFNNLLKARNDLVKKINKVDIDASMELIAERDVLVGVPDDRANRNDDDGITNAELVAIHTSGTPNAENLDKIDNLRGTGLSYEESRNIAMNLYLESTGSPGFHIPPRPIIEPALEANSDELAELMGEALQNYLWNPGNPEEGDIALEQVGLRAEGIVRGWFTDPQNNWPPNALSTIKQKGSDQPLIDTQTLRKSITYVIQKGDE